MLGCVLGCVQVSRRHGAETYLRFMSKRRALAKWFSLRHVPPRGLGSSSIPSGPRSLRRDTAQREFLRIEGLGSPSKPVRPPPTNKGKVTSWVASARDRHMKDPGSPRAKARVHSVWGR